MLNWERKRPSLTLVRLVTPVVVEPLEHYASYHQSDEPFFGRKTESGTVTAEAINSNFRRFDKNIYFKGINLIY
jgi:hypothetical protein